MASPVDLTIPAGAGNLRGMKKILLLLGSVLLLSGCVVKFRGQELLGINPDGRILFVHPETLGTNENVVPH